MDTKRNKVSIPGPVYIVVGAAVVLMSIFVGIQATGIEKMSLFVLVGAVFIVVGFLKVISREKKQTKLHTAHKAHPQKQGSHSGSHAGHASGHTYAQHKVSSHHASHHPSHHASHHADRKAPQHHSPSAHSAHKTTVMKCPNCGTKVHPSFKHCHNCGHMLKH